MKNRSRQGFPQYWKFLLPPTVENCPKEFSEATLRPFSSLVTCVSYEELRTPERDDGLIGKSGNGSLSGIPLTLLESEQRWFTETFR